MVDEKNVHRYKPGEKHSKAILLLDITKKQKPKDFDELI